MGLPLLYRRSPLTFPGGRPGFDPSHPAALGAYCSIVTPGGAFLNLLAGTTYPPTTAAPIVDGLIGPAVNSTASNNGASTTLPVPASISSATYAAIWRQIGSPGGPGRGCFVTTPANLTDTFGVTTGNVLEANATSTGLSIVNGNAYFAATSFVSGGKWATVLLNLTTGQILTQTSASGPAVSTSGTTCYFARNSAGRPLNGNLAAIAVSFNNLLSLPQLMAWAQRPWDFWYPPTVESLIFGNGMAPAPSISVIPHFLPFHATMGQLKSF